MKNNNIPSQKSWSQKLWLGKVSSIHEQEARERYWILRRELETNIQDLVSKLDIKKFEIKIEKDSVENYIKKRKKIINDHLFKIETKNKSKKNYYNQKKIKHIKATADKLIRLLSYYKILLKDKGYITRQETHLNLLWRDMTFIRTRLLTDYIISNEKLQHHLDFCRIEASKLNMQDDPEIKAYLDSAALELDNSSEHDDKKNDASFRGIFNELTTLGGDPQSSETQTGKTTVKHKKEQEGLIPEEERQLFHLLIKTIEKKADSTYNMLRRLRVMFARYVV